MLPPLLVWESPTLAGRRILLLGMSGLVVACAGGGGARPGRVTPAEIPALKAQAAQQPANAAVRFRLAAALMAAGRCDTAVVVAHAGEILAPGAALGPVVVGGCQEKDGRSDLAYATYTDFANRYPQARGVAAVRALAQLALRTQATQNARLALARESTLTALAPEPSTIAVLPMTIAGDSSFQPLSRGLAELVTSDLALVRSLRLLERLQIGTLLDEMKLGQSGRADPATAARVGRLLRAERMIQGVAAITQNGPVRMSAAVVRTDGNVRAGAQVNGQFKQLLDLEKQLVFGLATQLGIQLTEAERQRILRQGPKSLAAFLAYSAGLDAMDRGDYRAAAAAFGQASRSDPSFQAARDHQQAAEAAPAVQASGGGDVVTVVDAVAPVTAPAEPAALGALQQTTNEVSQTIGSSLTEPGVSSVASHPTNESQGITSVVSASGVIRIIFKLP
jgi:tetratricopeptide (TPR) repeat protein